MPLRESVRGAYRVYEVEEAGRTITLQAPNGLNEMLHFAAAMASSEPTPYWGELWPSSIALAAFILKGGLGPIEESYVLDIGAGLGLGGISALVAGAGEVTFADYYRDALMFASANAHANGQRRYRTQLVDWRRPDFPRRYEVVMGSDLLYEAGTQQVLLGAIEAAVAPGGRVFLSDPDRITADGFDAMARARGFSVERRKLAERISLYVLSPSAAAADARTA